MALLDDKLSTLINRGLFDNARTSAALDDVDQYKQTALANAQQEKKFNIDGLHQLTLTPDVLANVDADNIRFLREDGSYGNGRIVTQADEFGNRPSFDTAETNKDKIDYSAGARDLETGELLPETTESNFYDNPKNQARVDRQAAYFQKAFADTTIGNEEVFSQGELTNASMLRHLHESADRTKDQSPDGYANTYYKVVGQDDFGRDLVEFYDSEGNSVGDVFNTPDFNASYGDKSNYRRHNEDALAKRDAAALEKASREDKALLSDATSDTLVGEAINVGANFIEGSANLVGTFLAAPENTNKIDLLLNGSGTAEKLSDGERKALEALGIKADNDYSLSSTIFRKNELNRMNFKSFGKDAKAVKVTDDEREFIKSGKYAELMQPGSPYYKAIGENFDSARFLNQLGETVKEDFEGYANDKASKEITDTILTRYRALDFENEPATSTAKFSATLAKEIITNPAAAIQEFAKSLPMIISASTGVGALANLGAFTVENANESVDVFRDKYKRDPDTAETQLMIATGALAASFDIAAGKFITGQKILPTPLKKALGKFADKFKIESGVLKTIIDSKGFTVAKGAGKATNFTLAKPAVEGGQEVLQEALVIGAGIRGTDFDEAQTDKLITAGVLGALGGQGGNVYTIGKGSTAVAKEGVNAVNENIKVERTKNVFTRTRQAEQPNEPFARTERVDDDGTSTTELADDIYQKESVKTASEALNVVEGDNKYFRNLGDIQGLELGENYNPVEAVSEIVNNPKFTNEAEFKSLVNTLTIHTLNIDKLAENLPLNSEERIQVEAAYAQAAVSIETLKRSNQLDQSEAETFFSDEVNTNYDVKSKNIRKIQKSIPGIADVHNTILDGSSRTLPDGSIKRNLGLNDYRALFDRALSSDNLEAAKTKALQLSRWINTTRNQKLNNFAKLPEALKLVQAETRLMVDVLAGMEQAITEKSGTPFTAELKATPADVNLEFATPLEALPDEVVTYQDALVVPGPNGSQVLSEEALKLYSGSSVTTAGLQDAVTRLNEIADPVEQKKVINKLNKYHKEQQAKHNVVVPEENTEENVPIENQEDIDTALAQEFSAGRKKIRNSSLTELFKVDDSLLNDPEFISIFEGEPTKRQILNSMMAYFSLKGEMGADQIKDMQKMVRSFVLALPILRKLSKVDNNFLHSNDPVLAKLREDITGILPDELLFLTYLNAQSWLAFNGSLTLNNDERAINQLLGRDTKDKVTGKEFITFSQIGILRKNMINRTGANISANMAYKQRGDAPKTTQAYLNAGLGNFAFAYLLETGQVVEKSHTFEGSEVPTKFVQIALENGNISDAIIARNKIVGSAVNTMNSNLGFGFAQMVEPTTEPVKTTQSKSFKGYLDLNKEQIKQINELNSVSFSFTDAIRPLVSKNTTREQKVRLLRSLVDYTYDVGKEVHITERPSTEAKNRALDKEINDLIDYADKFGIDTEFFFEHGIKGSGRFHTLSNTLDYQNSTLHRFFIAATEAQRTIDLTTDNTLLDTYKIQVSLLFGMKETFPRDDHLDNFEGIYNAAKPLLSELPDVTSVESLAKISNYLKGIGERNPEGVEAFLDLYAYHNALTAGTTLSTSITAETDGITNGSAIGFMQFPLLNNMSGWLARVGIFENVEGGPKHYTDWRQQPGTRDSYESIVELYVKNYSTKGSKNYIFDDQPGVDAKGKTTDSLSQRLAKQYKKVPAAVKSIPNLEELTTILTGQLTTDNNEVLMQKLVNNENFDIAKDGRDLAKYPFMIFGFGGGRKAIQERIADILITELYSKITATASTKKGSVKRKQLGKLLGIDIVNSTKQEILDTVIPKDTENMLTNVFKQTVGRSMVNSIEESLDGFVDAKETLNQVINITARVYIEKFNSEINILKGDKGYVSNDDVVAVQNKLKNILPKIRGIDSKSNKEGLGLLKEQDVFSEKLINQIQTVVNSKEGNDNSVKTNILLKEFIDPGVSGLVKAIHSLDATIMAKAQLIAKRQGLASAHIFDASMGDSRFAKIYNKVFFETMRDYSITDDIMRTYRVAQIIAREDGINMDSITANVLTNDGEIELKDIPTSADFVKTSEKLEVRIKKNKAELFSKALVVDQMTFPDGKSGYETAAQNVADESVELEDPLNSDQGAIDTATFVATDEKAATSDTVLNIFKLFKASAHKAKSAEYSAHLERLVNDYIAPGIKAMDPIIVKINQKANSVFGQVTGDKVYINNSPNHPTLSGKDGEEVYVHELLHIFSKAAIKDSSNGIYNRIKTLHKLAKDVVKPEDFIRDGSANTVDEMAQATRTYDYIFSSDNKNVIDEFFVHVLSNEQLGKRLSTTGTNTREIKYGKRETLFDRFLNILESMVLWAKKVINKSSADNISDEMLEIARDVSRLNNRSENRIFSNANKFGNMVNTVNAKVGKFTIDSIEGISNRVGNSDETRPLINKALAIPGKLIRHAKAVQAAPDSGVFKKSAVKSLNNIANTFSDPASNLRKLTTEVLGPKPELAKFFELLRYSKKKIDSDRKDVSTITKKDILASIETTMSDADKAAATKVLVRTDLTQLLDNYSIETIIDMLTDPVLLQQSIDDVTNKLSAVPLGAQYIKFATALGNYMVTGEAIHNLPLSAINIARGVGFGQGGPYGRVAPYAESSVVLIDTLAGLEALRKTDGHQKQLISDFYYREEEANPEGNGFTNIMDIIKGSKQAALEKNFAGNESLIVKGHFAQIQDLNTAVKVAPLSDQAKLKEEGFILEDPLEPDPADVTTGEPIGLYVAKNSYMINTVKGIMSQSNLHNIGTKLSSNEVMQTGGIFNNILIQRRVNMVEAEHTIEAMKSASQRTYLIPVYNRTGQITDYRYIMSTSNKEKYLDIDYSIENVLGKMQADIVNKANTDGIHREMGKLLKQDYDEHYSDDPRNFIKISEKTTPDIYRLIPTTMRKDLKLKFKNRIYVRKEMLDVVFGYRKASLANLSYKDTELIPKRIQKFVVVAEALWQIIIANEKVNIVIKTPQVLIDNVISNSVILLINGISPVQGIKDYKEALLALKSYSEDHEKLIKYQTILAGIPKNDPRRARIQATVNTQQNYISNNPVSKLIDEGLFQGITEDVEISNYGIKANLLEKIDKSVVGKVTPSLVKKGLNQLYMSEGTVLFQLLLKATQQSDFIARYSLYKHQIKKGVSEKDALQNAVDTFINYDAPHTKEVQYLNDMGLFMFTKFFMRIQRVIAKQLKENTSKSVLGILAQYGLSDIPDILDTSLVDTDITQRMYPNPWKHIMGALDFKLLELLGITD